MGLTYNSYLSSPTKVYGCAKCRTHLTTAEAIMSKSFVGQHGRAILFKEVVNVKMGAPSDRYMTTGLHTVRDLSCIECGEVLGWHYDKAFEAREKYKEGRCILERALLTDVD